MTVLFDDVYGESEINSGLLNELILSSSVSRLKSISQAGASSLVRDGRSVTRYEHSVGVMTLVGRLGGSELEQAAGLLQDVSHTAFSHTIDYVFDDREEKYHERIFDSIIKDSDISKILERHGLSLKIINENMRLVDSPSPDLCCDRIDYTLRDLLRLSFITSSEILEFVNALATIDGMIYVINPELSLKFCGWYRYLVRNVFMNPIELYSHSELADIIRKALELNIIEINDLMNTDEFLLFKLASDRCLAKRLASLYAVKKNQKKTDNNYGIVYSKARIVDPMTLFDGKLIRTSVIYPEINAWWMDISIKAKEGIRI